MQVKVLWAEKESERGKPCFKDRKQQKTKAKKKKVSAKHTVFTKVFTIILAYKKGHLCPRCNINSLCYVFLWYSARVLPIISLQEPGGTANVCVLVCAYTRVKQQVCSVWYQVHYPASSGSRRSYRAASFCARLEAAWDRVMISFVFFLALFNWWWWEKQFTSANTFMTLDSIIRLEQDFDKDFNKKLN